MTSNRGRFRPEPIPAAILASERGHLEVVPELAWPGQFRLWLYGDGSLPRPCSILMTVRDVRGLRVFLADVERGSQAAPQIVPGTASWPCCRCTPEPASPRSAPWTSPTHG